MPAGVCCSYVLLSLFQCPVVVSRMFIGHWFSVVGFSSYGGWPVLGSSTVGFLTVHQLAPFFRSPFALVYLISLWLVGDVLHSTQQTDVFLLIAKLTERGVSPVGKENESNRDEPRYEFTEVGEREKKIKLTRDDDLKTWVVGK